MGSSTQNEFGVEVQCWEFSPRNYVNLGRPVDDALCAGRVSRLVGGVTKGRISLDLELSGAWRARLQTTWPRLVVGQGFRRRPWNSVWSVWDNDRSFSVERNLELREQFRALVFGCAEERVGRALLNDLAASMKSRDPRPSGQSPFHA